MPADLDARIRAYIAAMPPAISGTGGCHITTLKAANALVLGFALSFDDAWPHIKEYNQRCEPPWSDRQLEHKLNQAAANKKGLPLGYLLDGAVPHPSTTQSTRPPKKELTKGEKIALWTNAVVTKLDGWRADEYDVWESSVVRLMDDYQQDARLAITTLADDPDDLINVNCNYREKPDGKGVDIVGLGMVRTVAEWNAFLAEHPMPFREAGCWWRVNPVRSRRGSGSDGSFTDADISKFRFHLFEIDHLSLELQLSFFCRMRIPVAMISDSGGKSYHALVQSRATSLAEFVDEAHWLLDDVFAQYGIDPSNKNPSRYSRLPGVPRKIGARALQDGETEARQKILFLNHTPTGDPIL